MTLSAVNTYTGTTSVLAGLLQAAGGQAIPDSSPVTMASGAALTLLANETIGSLAASGTNGVAVNLGSFALASGGNGGSTAFDGVISGTGGRLIKQGAGVFTLNGSSSYSGGTSIDNGVLVVNGVSAAAGTGTITVGANRLNINNGATVANAVTVAGGAIGNTAGAGTLTGATTLASSSYVDSDGGTGLLVAGAMGGGGGITAKAGTVTLSGTNAYGGATAVSVGELKLQNGAAVPDGSALTLANGSTLTLLNSETVGSLSGSGATTAQVNLGANTLTAGGNGGSTAFDGTINGNNGQLTKIGGGTLTLSGANTYTGATAVLGGTLALAASHVMANDSAVTVNAGTLDIGAHNDTVASVSLQGGGTISGSTGVLTSTAAFDLRSGTVTAVLGGTAGAVKTSLDSVTLSAVNTYTGTTRINEGALLLTGSGRLANTGSANVAASGTLTLAGDQALDNVTLAGTVNGSGTLSANSFNINGGRIDVALVTRSLDSTGASTVNGNTAADTFTISSGNLTLSSSNLLSDGAAVTVAAPATLTMAGSDTVGSLTLLGTLAGTGTLTAQTYALNGGTALANLGAGDITSSGTSLVNGTAAVSTLAVQAGSLVLGSAGRLTALPAVTVAGGAVLAMGGNERIGTLAGAGTLALGAATLSTGVGGSTLFDGVVTGTGALVKQGTGRFTLAGSNTYTGDTVVESGTLALAAAGRLSDATAVNVATGATLSLAAADTVASLQLAGTLDGAGTLTATTYGLSSATVNANLGHGALVSSGTSTLSGRAALDSVTVNAGSFSLASAGRMTATPAVAVDAGATLALGGNETFGTLSGSGTVALGAATLGTGVTGSSTFGGVLSGSGGLDKQGDSVFTLSGGNTFTGATLVSAGNLVLSGAERLANTSAVTVAGPATLTVNASEIVASLALRGTLAGTGTLTAATYALAGGTANANLGTGTLSSSGSSTMAGSSNAGTVAVDGGQLTLASANRLADGSALTVAAGSSMTLSGDDRVGSLELRGTLNGSGTLTAATYLIDSGTASANLGAGALTSTGASKLNATSAADSVAVTAGTFTLGSANRLLALPLVTVAPGARLALGGDDRFGSLSGAGTVGLGAATLSTGAAGSSTFSGVIDGAGGIVKQGATTTFGLTGANAFTGPTRVAEGILTIGNHAAGGSMATSNYLVDGVLQSDRADAMLFDKPISGSGAVEQIGLGTLTMKGNNKTYTGQTRVISGRLATDGAENLSDTSDVRVAPGAELVLAGNETVKSVDADGTVAIASLLKASGALNLKGAVTAISGAAVALQAQQIDAVNPGNRWGSSVALNTTGAVNLSAGKDGEAFRDLKLGTLSIGGGNSRIDAGLIELTALSSLTGGTLVLDASSGAVFVAPGADLIGKLTPANRQIAFTQDVVTQAAGSRIEVADGAQLQVVASKGGSVALLTSDVGAVPTAGNTFNGGLSVRAGGKADGPTPWDANKVTDAKGVAGLEYSLQSRVRISGSQVTIGSTGIEADVVTLKADAVKTPGAVQIVARLPYDNLVGTTSSLPGLSFELTPASFLTAGSYGQSGSDININVGSKAFGPRTSLPVDSGYVTLLPRGGAKGSTAVFLKGPLVAGTYGFFYDGSGIQSEVPVFYNGVSAVTPQVQGSISSTVSVSESARKERFEEAVRTENVALRLRAGVIAEVGPGMPATTTSGSLDKMRPPRCEPAEGTLGCAKP